jgi:putative transposase
MKRPHPKAVLNRTSSPRDLTDAAWSILEPLLPPAKPGGHPRTVTMREILTTIVSRVRGGYAWRAFPPDVPCWPTVWTSVRNGRLTEAWERMQTALREAVRTTHGRETTPSAAIRESSSVRSGRKGASRTVSGVWENPVHTQRIRAIWLEVRKKRRSAAWWGQRPQRSTSSMLRVVSAMRVWEGHHAECGVKGSKRAKKSI